MSVFSTALTIVTALGGGATIKGIFDYVRENRKRIDDLKNQAGTHEISAWEQWRKDNETLRAEIGDLRNEIAGLRADFKVLETDNRHLVAENDRLMRDLGTEKAAKEKSLEDNRNLQIQLEAALRAADAFSIAAQERKRIQEERLKELPPPATNENESIDP